VPGSALDESPAFGAALACCATTGKASCCDEMIG
jgi:hypothetical protein